MLRTCRPCSRAHSIRSSPPASGRSATSTSASPPSMRDTAELRTTITARRPLGSLDDLVRASGEVWRGLDGEDWDEAFASHPRIGERHAAGEVSARASAWSAREQGAAVQSGGSVVAELGEANRRYEERFGRIFLICASGRSGGEILQQIELRMGNDPETELAVAGEEQRKITELRLQRWLQEATL